VQEDSQNECEKEQYGVHDAQRPGRFQHGAVFVEMECPARTTIQAIVPKRAQVDED
jgi:hypothetical protein